MFKLHEPISDELSEYVFVEKKSLRQASTFSSAATPDRQPQTFREHVLRRIAFYTQTFHGKCLCNV